MSRCFALVPVTCVLMAVGCAGSRPEPSPVPPPPVIPISASSMPSVYGIQLRLDGSAVVRDGWLHLDFPAGAVRTYQGEAEAWDLMLRARLATCGRDGEWQVASESRAARLAPIAGLTRDSSMLDTATRAFTDTLRLDLGIPPGADLARTWVAVELAWPVGSVLAAYTLHTATTLAAAAPNWDAARPADTRCRI